MRRGLARVLLATLLPLTACSSGNDEGLPPCPKPITSDVVAPGLGGRIAFETTGLPYPGYYHCSSIFVMNADGGGLRRVTPAPETYPSEARRSPDGRQFVFSGACPDTQHMELCVINEDGTGLRPLSTGTRQLRLIKASGGPSTVLARDGTVNESPAFSHDGRRIAFSSNRAAKPESAYVERVRRSPGSEWLPRSGAHDIYAVGVDGKGLTRLTSDPSANYSPAWSPDDRHVAFISDRDDNHNLYVMAADGKDVVRLSALEASSPNWFR